MGLAKLNVDVHLMCGSRKYPHPPHGGLLENPRGRGVVLRAKIVNRKYEPKLEFPEAWGRGFKPKIPP